MVENPHASGRAFLQASGDGEAKVEAVFAGAPWLYAITVGYFDETDGASRAEIRVNGAAIDTWVWDGDFGQATVTAAGFATRSVIGVALDPGDIVAVAGVADGGEPLRVDWIEFTSLPRLGAGRIEAESLGEVAGVSVETNPHASRGAYLQATGAGESRAAMVFDGADGCYDLTVAYFDESDGESRMEIRVNGATVDAWDWDGTHGDAIVTAAGRAERAVFGGELASGDTIEFVGRADGGEPLRTDWVKIVSLHDDSL